MSAASPVIGFAGMGKMGTAMATCLLKAGHTVRVYNRTMSKTEPLVQLGATAVASPTELADVDVLFTIVNDAAALESLLVEHGLLAALGEAARGRVSPAVHACCATLPVDYAQALVPQHAQVGVDYASMPVLGRPEAAAAAKLHFLFAGSAAAAATLEPLVVPAMGQSFRNYGIDPHKANVMKITFNMMLGLMIESLGQGAALVQRYGIPTKDFTSLLSETLFDCVAYRSYGEAIANRAFLPAGASLTGVGLKDLTLAVRAGEQARVPLPYASMARDDFLSAIANGMGEWDWSAVAVIAEQRAGITPAPAPEPEPKG